MRPVVEEAAGKKGNYAEMESPKTAKHLEN